MFLWFYAVMEQLWGYKRFPISDLMFLRIAVAVDMCQLCSGMEAIINFSWSWVIDSMICLDDDLDMNSMELLSN